MTVVFRENERIYIASKGLYEEQVMYLVYNPIFDGPIPDSWKTGHDRILYQDKIKDEES